MIDLSGRVALITGSARGIGRGCALEMAKAGADIAVNYHTQLEAAEEVAAAVRTMGRKAVVIGADVAVRDQVDAMVAETVEHLGRLDIAVCNAARSHRAPFLDLTVEQVRETLNVTLWGVFHVAQASPRQMVARARRAAPFSSSARCTPSCRYRSRCPTTPPRPASITWPRQSPTSCPRTGYG